MDHYNYDYYHLADSEALQAFCIQVIDLLAKRHACCTSYIHTRRWLEYTVMEIFENSTFSQASKVA